MDDDNYRIETVLFIGSILGMLTFGCLMYLAFGEQSITLGGGRGSRPQHYEGQSAINAGYLLLGGFIFCFGILYSNHIYRKLIWLILAIIWLICIGILKYYIFKV